MNKKFSTLAAVLLASGGLTYAVSAMVIPAMGEAQQMVSVITKGGEEAPAKDAAASNVVVGYTLGFDGEITSQESVIANWTVNEVAQTIPANKKSLKVNSPKSYYLTVAEEKADSQSVEKTVFYLNDKFKVVKAVADDAMPVDALQITFGEAGALTVGDNALKVDPKTGELSAPKTQMVDGDVESTLKSVMFATSEGVATETASGDVALVAAEAVSVVSAARELRTEGGTTYTISGQVTLDPIEQATDAPGADIPGMSGIEGLGIDESGKLEYKGESEVITIPAPTSLQIVAKNYLVVNADGSVTTSDKPAEASAWVLKNGKYKNVEAEKAGKKAIWLKYSAVSTTAFRATAVGSLVEDASKATAFALTKDGLKVGDQVVSAVITTVTTAPTADLDNANKSNLITGALSNGQVVVLGQGSSYANAKQAYVVEVVKALSGEYQYKFRKVGSTTDYLTIPASNETVFTSVENAGAGMALMAGGKYLTIAADGTGAVSLDVKKESTAFYAAAAETGNFNAKYIIETRGTQSSFNLSLWDEKDGNSNLIQNPFADADLVPMKWNGGSKKLEVATTTEETFLLKKGNSYIVLNVDDKDVWGNMGSQVSDGGYKFTTISAATMEKYLNNGLAEKSYYPYFTFSYDKNGSGLEKDGSLTAKTPLYQISVSETSAAIVATDYKLVSFEINTGAQKGVYLTVDKAGKRKVYAEFSASNAITGDLNKDYNPLKMQYVNITFANHSSIRDAKDAKVVLNGRVLGADLKSADKSEFLFNKPEGQWIVKMTGATDANALSKAGASVADLYAFTFKNRESSKEYKAEKIYYLGDNKYAVQSSTQVAKASGDVTATRDTLIITPIATALKNNTVQLDGYANLKALDVQDEQFRLLVASAEKDYYVGENHAAKSHFLGLSHEESASVNWRIVPLTGKRAYDSDGLLKTASDSIYTINYPQYYNADKKMFFAHKDTVAIVSYALQNTANGEYLTYETPQTTTIQSMICDPNFTTFKTTKDVTAAYRFVMKEKADGLYNIVGVDGRSVTYDKNGYLSTNANPFYSLDLTSKLYGATTLTKQGAVEVEGAYAQINSNDLFKVEKVAAPEYRKLAQGDTIRIFRDENKFDTMFENGEFLNLGNTAQLKDMAPALYVDTAYVNRNNGHENRYQYLLAVNVDRVEPAYCDIPNHPTLHPDTTYGRFLVNLVDSAVYAYRHGAIHTNKYINDKEADEVYVKLGFVWGYRTADKLFLTEGKDFSKVKDVIDLSTRDFNIAKFAFRFVNPTNADDQSFKIQTRYVNYNQAKDANKKDWEEHNEGYLKTINGVVVVTDKYTKGEEFNLAAEKSTPTSNDQIGATEVQVIAGNGVVTVKGAAGKLVVVNNILGQTIASTVLTSDNATIAVPAGIVVVAVEGEETVKTVVK